MSEMKKPLLSISMLVSNGRTDTIKKCMESLVPLRKAVSSELILVDTGCTDGSIEIAREYADKVVKFTWCNDFSAARNAGLCECSGEWFMYLDDDEWFEDVSELIWFFQSEEYKKYGRAVYLSRNYENFEGTSYQDRTMSRLSRLTPGLRFKGKIHEYLPMYEGDTYYCSCYVHHYGYVHKTKEEFQKHTERNLTILKQVMEENPEDSRNAAHLVQEYIVSKNYDEAERVCRETLALCRKLKIEDYYEYLVLALPIIYREQGKKAEAEKENLRIYKEEHLSKYAWTKYFAEKCILEKQKKDGHAALESMRRYFLLYEDKNDRGVALLDFLYYSSPACMDNILKIGIEAVLELKEYRYAELIFSRVNWQEKNPVPYEWVKFLQQYFTESKDLKLFQKYNKKIKQIPELKAFEEQITAEKEEMVSDRRMPILSISMLVSNGRKETIKKCMESLILLRKAVSNELILVDTGCTDGSIDIAREYADKVLTFPWCNDFSAARNAGLCACTGEWFLYLDDDEWFEDTTEIEQFFLSGEYKKYDGAWYIQRNYDSMEGRSFTDNYVGRMQPLTKETRFVSKIHEYLVPTPERVKRFQTFVHHYGYVYKNEEERQKRILRNLPLEEEIVAENPKDIRMCCQLVQEYRGARRQADAERVCRETLARKLYPESNSFMQYLLTCIPRIHAEQGKNQEALEEFEALENSGRLSYMSILLCMYEKLRLYDVFKDNEKLLLQAERYLRLRENKPSEEDYPIMDFATYLSDMLYQRVAENGIKAMLRLNDFQKAEFFFERIDWNREASPREDYIKSLLLIYQETGNQKLLLMEAEKIDAISSLRGIWFTETESFLKIYSGIAPAGEEAEDANALTKELFQKKARNYTEAAKKAPIMVPVVRVWMKAAELDILSKQMREIIAASIKSGDMAQAQKLLAEVESMLPGEDWIRELKEKLSGE